jgi:RNA polymerase sigma-70 factor (ECF subfamily)
MLYFCRDEEAAGDGVSHAFTQALVNRLMLENMPEPAMKAWLYAAARNAVVDIKRRESRLSSLPDENTFSVIADTRLSDLTDRAAAEALVEKLSSNLRAVVRMRYFGGMNATEIGRALHLSPATVRTKLRAALQIMRRKFNSKD